VISDELLLGQLRSVDVRVSNPGFTEPENPGNPEIFQTRKTGFGQPANPGFWV